MAWQYESSTGKLYDTDGKFVGQGYAGGGLDKNNAICAAGKNNPAYQNVHNCGPLPEGMYTANAPVDTQTHGPYVSWCTPDDTNEMYGRDFFGMHGDSVVDPGWASDGCIVQTHATRVAWWESGDRRLQVLANIGASA